VLERGEKIDSLVAKSDGLSAQSKMFYTQVSHLIVCPASVPLDIGMGATISVPCHLVFKTWAKYTSVPKKILTSILRPRNKTAVAPSCRVSYSVSSLAFGRFFTRPCILSNADVGYEIKAVPMYRVFGSRGTVQAFVHLKFREGYFLKL
jgi:hypothetical protein